jgi:hypothetical protein
VVSVKATSVIFFLGVGGFVCYKLYHYYWPKSPPDSPDPGSSPTAKSKAFAQASSLGHFYNAKRQLLDPGEEAPFGSVHVSAFLPIIKSSTLCVFLVFSNIKKMICCN